MATPSPAHWRRSNVRLASPQQESHRRSLAKAVSWRATGTVDTFILSWIITGDARIAGTISAVEVVTKVALFYLHERAWTKIRWGKSE